MANVVSVEKYEEMWASFCESQTVDHVANKTGVSWTTAKRYVENGDPKRGLKSLRSRFAAAQTKASAKAEDKVARAQTVTLKACETAKFVALRQLGELAKDHGGRFADPMKALEVAHKVESAVLGVAGETLGVAHSGAAPFMDPFAGADEEDVVRFLDAGLQALKRAGYGRKQDEPDPSALVDVAKVLKETVH